MLSDTFSRQGLTPNKLKSTVVLHIGQPVKIVVAEPDRVIVAEQRVFKETPDSYPTGKHGYWEPMRNLKEALAKSVT